MRSESTKENKQIELKPRPPVVVVLGHVDSGKTTILDFIRKSNVVEKESGGITQHIGAYEVEVPEEPKSRVRQAANQGSRFEKAGIPRFARDDFAAGSRKITFIDTPGHEAFSAMRSRGAKVADIAVLVVDATAGVQPQTKEAIKAIKKAGLSFVVALNKMDKKTAQPQRVKNQLAAQGVLIEEMGGKVPLVETSAKTGKGIDDLLEMILLLAEMAELKADYGAKPQGTIIESLLDAKQGATASLILCQGVLKVEDIVATKSAFGRVKALFNFQGKPLEKALPSQPIRVLGFNTVPRVGEQALAYDTLEQARRMVSDKRQDYSQVLRVPEGKKVLNVIIKADVLGSLEAIEGILEGLPQEKVILRILAADVGNVNITDVQTATAAAAQILAFRTGIEPKAKKMLLQRSIRVYQFDVVYELVQAVRRAMEQALEPEVKRQVLGQFKVTVLFKQGVPEQIIGGKILKGGLTKNIAFEVRRKQEVVGKGRIKNIQQEKRDVGKAKEGQEAALLVEAPFKIKEGDILEAYKKETKKAVL